MVSNIRCIETSRCCSQEMKQFFLSRLSATHTENDVAWPRLNAECKRPNAWGIEYCIFLYFLQSCGILGLVITTSRSPFVSPGSDCVLAKQATTTGVARGPCKRIVFGFAQRIQARDVHCVPRQPVSKESEFFQLNSRRKTPGGHHWRQKFVGPQHAIRSTEWSLAGWGLTFG